MASVRRMSAKPGAVIFLTGPPAAGKTTTALLWSVQRARPTWPVEWDATASALGAARDLGFKCLPDDVGERYGLAAAVMAKQAEEITSGGNDCVVVGAWALDWPGPDPWQPLGRLNPVVCVLLPNVETSVRRNANDPHRQGVFAVPEVHVRGSHSLSWRLWADQPRAVVIDNSKMTVQETVDVLEREAKRLVAQ